MGSAAADAAGILASVVRHVEELHAGLLGVDHRLELIDQTGRVVIRRGDGAAPNTVESTPILQGGATVGTLRLACDAPRAARVLLGQLGRRMERDFEHHQIQRQLDHTMRLHAVATALAGASTVDDCASIVVNEAVTALGASAGVLYQLDERQELRLLAHRGLRLQPDRHVRLPLDSPLPLAEAVRSGRPVWFESRREIDAARLPWPVQDGVAAMFAVPLQTRGRTLGGAGFSFGQARGFDEGERRFVLHLADLVALALDRAVLFDRERVDRARSSRRDAARRVLDAAQGAEYTLDRVLQLVVPVLADWACVYLVRGESLELAALVAGDPAAEREARPVFQAAPLRLGAARGFGAVAATGHPELSAVVEPAAEDGELRLRLGARSMVVVPLIGDRRVIGALGMALRSADLPYDAADLEFAQRLAARCVAAIAG